MVRGQIPRENKLILEWLQKFHSNNLQWRRVRVGPLPKGIPKELAGILRRWADAIFIEDNIVNIVEAKIKPDPGALGQLQHYARLFPETPEFSDFKFHKIKLIFLTTINDPAVATLCDEQGVKFIVYSPAWVKKYHLERAQKMSRV